MNWREDFSDKLKNFLKPDQFIFDAPMKEHTTFKIGGTADVLIFPSTVEEVTKVLKLIDDGRIPLTILGNGSNVLVRDKGIRGAVVKFNGKFSQIKRDETKLIIGAGAKLKDVSNFAADNGLTGMEFAVGIPGSIGGAVYMNAGAYGGEMKDVLKWVKAVDQNGEVKTLPVAVQAFVGSYVKQWNLILAAALLAIVPMVVLFLFAQKQIMEGMIEGAVKG